MRTYVLLGDGECQEGQVWEAAHVAPRFRADNLIAIVDHNQLQQFGWRGAHARDRLPPEDPGDLAARFAAFGWRVLEMDGHDMAAGRGHAGGRRPSPRAARWPSSPTRVKGRGVSFMEGDYAWHMGVPTRRAVRHGHGRARGAGGGASMSLPMGRALREVFGEVVTELAASDPRIVMLDGDLGSSTRAQVFEDAFPERYYQMGIAEQNMLGVAAGMAMMGCVPFISTFVAFALHRPLDQIRVLIAQTGANVKITAGYTGLFTGRAGKTHQIVDDISIARAMPGMVVISPADEVETREVLALVRWRTTGPSSSASSATSTAEPLPAGPPLPVRQGQGRPRGPRHHPHQHRHADAPRRGRSGDPGRAAASRPTWSTCPPSSRSTWPASWPPPSAAGRVVTVEEHSVIGGLGGAVAETLSEHRPTRVDRIGIQDHYTEVGQRPGAAGHVLPVRRASRPACTQAAGQHGSPVTSCD